jgi:hypothetical protein
MAADSGPKLSVEELVDSLFELHDQVPIRTTSTYENS